MNVPKKRKAPKGLPKRTGNATMKTKTARHFSRAMDRKYRHVLHREGLEAAQAWKLRRIQTTVGLMKESA